MTDQFVAEIRTWPANFEPVGWAFCNGQLLPINTNTALFSLLGTNYGGDGKTTFALPNLMDRVPTHAGQGPGLSNVALGSSQPRDPPSATVPTAVSVARDMLASNTTATMQTQQTPYSEPVLGLNYIIALQGIFPPRS
ncbi:MAG: phage tail protein [Solimonas sp.]